MMRSASRRPLTGEVDRLVPPIFRQLLHPNHPSFYKGRDGRIDGLLGKKTLLTQHLLGTIFGIVARKGWKGW